MAPSMVEWLALLATAALVLITFSYAQATKRLVAATEAMVNAMKQTVDEMAAARLQQEDDRRREKSQAAAELILEQVRVADELCEDAGANRYTGGPCGQLARVMRRHGGAICDVVVRERVDRCRSVLQSFSKNWVVFPGDRGVAELHVQHLVRTIRGTLEAHIYETDVPAWPPNYPDDVVGAYAWLVRRSGGG